MQKVSDHARRLGLTSTSNDASAATTVYRPMGDGEACHLVAHGVLPTTQPGDMAYESQYRLP